jgi:hypothetical protein
MPESAISNGHRPGATERLTPPSQLYPRPAQLVDQVDVPLGPKHSKPTRLGRFHEFVVTSSYCSAIFVLGIAVGVVWNR